MNTVLAFWRGHGTKLIGFLQGTIAAIAGVSDIIPPQHLKYYLGASAVLTFWRGFLNDNFRQNP